MVFADFVKGLNMNNEKISAENRTVDLETQMAKDRFEKVCLGIRTMDDGNKYPIAIQTNDMHVVKGKRWSLTLVVYHSVFTEDGKDVEGWEPIFGTDIQLGLNDDVYEIIDAVLDAQPMNGVYEYTRDMTNEEKDDFYDSFNREDEGGSEEKSEDENDEVEDDERKIIGFVMEF